MKPAVRTALLLLGVAGAGWAGARLGSPTVEAPAVSHAGEERAASTAPEPAAQRAPETPRPPAPRAQLPPRAPSPSPFVTTLASQHELVDGAEGEERAERAARLVRSSDPYERFEGMTLLYDTDKARAAEESRRALRERDPALAPVAARVLAMEGGLDEEELQILADMVADTSLTPEERTAANGSAMRALREAGSPQVGAWYDRALGSDVSMVRGSAVANVVTLPTEQAVPLLVKALKDPDERIAASAKSALVHMHGGNEELGADPAAWQAWLDERRVAAERKAADDYAMRHPQVQNRPEDDHPTDDYEPTTAPPAPPGEE